MGVIQLRMADLLGNNTHFGYREDARGSTVPQAEGEHVSQ